MKNIDLEEQFDIVFSTKQVIGLLIGMIDNAHQWELEHGSGEVIFAFERYIDWKIFNHILTNSNLTFDDLLDRTQWNESLKSEMRFESEKYLDEN